MGTSPDQALVRLAQAEVTAGKTAPTLKVEAREHRQPAHQRNQGRHPAASRWRSVATRPVDGKPPGAHADGATATLDVGPAADMAWHPACAAGSWTRACISPMAAEWRHPRRRGAIVNWSNMMVQWFSRPGGGSDLMDRYHAAQRTGAVPLHPADKAMREISRKLLVNYSPRTKPRYKYVKFIHSAPLYDKSPEPAGSTIAVDPSRNFGAEMLLLAKPGVFLVSLPDYRGTPQEPQ